MDQSTFQIHTYHLPPTALVPNSPHPLLHYRNFNPHYPTSVQSQDPKAPSKPKPSNYTALFHANSWTPQWIYRYAPTQHSHYHSTTHECMVVLSGTATIRFGVADTSDNMHANASGADREQGSVEIKAKVGDVFIVPAGVAHKTHDASPEAEFALLSPGDGHGVDVDDAENGKERGRDLGEVLDQVELSGFTMLGAYPEGCEWDSKEGGEVSKEKWTSVWSVPVPERDPVLGESGEGLVGLWKAESRVEAL